MEQNLRMDGDGGGRDGGEGTEWYGREGQGAERGYLESVLRLPLK